MSAKRRVCIIGAGTAGLSALKNSLQHGLDATAYEQTPNIGGTWVYDENTTEARYGYDDGVHSSMYEGLRTNLPKEVMSYPDFFYPETIKESFVTSQEVLNFLNSYADNFNLKEHIKFQHEVIRVRPRKGEWEVYLRNIVTDVYYFEYFDFVFVCNGHYTTPMLPEIEGMDVYKGIQMHSHVYRKASLVKDAKVLIIGAGPSGIDIANQVSKAAARVFLSHHLTPPPNTGFMRNVTQKPDLDHFTETGAQFKDGTTEDFDFVIFCTGYKYTFPCLSSECDLKVTETMVYPLYKHCININYPSMALIGLPFNVCPTQLFDLQVRFCLKYYIDEKQLPSREDMLADMEKDMEQRKARGLSKRQTHQMGEKQVDYYKELSELADITCIRPVIVKMMEDCGKKYIYELETYRDNCFRIIDDDNFVKFKMTKA